MKRAQRLLLIAFALSLLIHLLVALVARPPALSTQNQPEKVSLEHRRVVIAVRKLQTPPPPPKPRPLPRPVASAPPVRKAHGIVAHAPSGGGRSVATPAPATPSPAPTSAASGCARPDAQAAVITPPAAPDIAASVRAAGTSGIALVRVQLDAQGEIADTSVAQTTGNPSLDLVAVAMARDARYTPALHDCKPIASAYIFSVKFVAW
jgi:TonB family protein